MRNIGFTLSLFLLVCFPAQFSAAESKGSDVKALELEAVLSGKDLHYEYYKKFRDKYYYSGTKDAFEPLKDFKADSKGGEVKFYDSVPAKGLCGVLFKWKFDRDIVKVKPGEEVGVTLSYDILKKECVEPMAQGWIAFTLNDPYYEQFLLGDLDQKVKEGLPEGTDIVRGPDVGAVALDGKRGNMSSEFKIKFPEPVESGTYLILRLTIFRYYFPNTPVAVYLFKAE